MRQDWELRDMWQHGYQAMYGLSYRTARSLTTKDIEQLSLCRSDEARRLLLGVSHVSQA